ncbi:transposase [Escherichia coli TW10246]|nr:transposase [Escherichia coli TW10246]
MNDISSDDIFLLKQRLAEQEALIHALQEKLSNREREIDHLQAQLDKLRRMNFGSRSEKVSRRIAQMEADLNRLQKESDTLTGRVYDPAVQRPLRQTRTRKPFPESLPRDEKRLLPAAPCCPNCGGSLSYLGEDTAEQLELMRSAFRVIRTVREKHACTQCDAIVQAPAPSRPIERGIAGPGLLARVLTSKYAEHTPLYRQSEIYGRQGVELRRSLLSGWVDACCRLLSPLEEALHGYVMTDGKLHADDTPVRYCCRVIRRRRPGDCGRMFVMTAMQGQRWHLQCGSLTARTEKASIRRLILPASAVCCKRMRTPGSTSCIAMVG